MSEISLRFPDKDLIPLLRKCDNDELDPLVGYVTKKGRFSSQLESTKAYKNHYPDHRWYADEIGAEIQKFGGNTLANIARGGKGVLYKEIVCDVADRLKVNYNKKQETDFIEMQILFKILEKSWEKMDDEEKKYFLDDLAIKTISSSIPKQFPLAALQTAIIAGGFKSYSIGLKISLNVANSTAKLILGRGLSLEANNIIAKYVTNCMAFISGPVGWAITALWTIKDFSSPAYRVTVPGVCHIAMLRQLHVYKGDGDDLIAAVCENNQAKIEEEWEKLRQKEAKEKDKKDKNKE